MSNANKEAALRLLSRLSKSPVGDRLVLAGSSGLFAASAGIPALTEDMDVLVDADWLAEAEGTVISELAKAGLEHQAETCSFLSQDGSTLDLVGYSRSDRQDRIGGGKRVPVMVFADLSTLLARPGAVVEVPGGGRALSAAALTAAKLLTVRVEKGGKDKLQALLLIDEHQGDPEYLKTLERFLSDYELDRVEDALADAGAALLGLEVDPERTDLQARGYAAASKSAARGLDTLQQLVHPGEGDS